MKKSFLLLPFFFALFAILPLSGHADSSDHEPRELTCYEKARIVVEASGQNPTEELDIDDFKNGGCPAWVQPAFDEITRKSR